MGSTVVKIMPCLTTNIVQWEEYWTGMSEYPDPFLQCGIWRYRGILVNAKMQIQTVQTEQ